ncbi:serine--tRNA ligase [Nisaea acidiphila]|uniref:Serine--tRNA ligase n=1 Tax=Nisaea acidiphila TaxID=1862145 RepID=A0A9J7ATB7_9PROT|nr:serine--tRNA ligase [Nisaea acidiphila]UUX50098.1 serine--tRNA ligase [Nisaea acidiphila]
MHDIRWIREDGAAFDKAMARRGFEPQAGAILEIDQKWRDATTELQTLQQRRNEASKEIGKVKGQGGDADALIKEVADIKARMQQLEDEERALSEQLDGALSALPNIMADDVPDGPDESANVEIRKVGEATQKNAASPDHVAIGESLGMMDFEAAAKLSGARFTLLKGQLSRLERALANFMLDIHTGEFGYTEVSPPYMVRDAALYGTGQLPKFGDDLFKTTGDHWLIPTAEVPLTNIAAGEILAEEELPLRFTAYTPCFRSEAGSAGRDTRGMIRLHQFSKVELVSVTHPDKSEEEHERMTNCAEEVLKRLGLSYRVVTLCSGDTGFGARKTYDIEVWLPGQDDGKGMYREISSCSNCWDFQARRMKARYREAGGKKTAFVHTLNGSALAVGRTLIAVLENYAEEDGSVSVPEALQPYMGGLTRISAAG